MPRLGQFFEGIGGTVHYSFFCAPEYIDLQKKPGSTSLKSVVPTSLFEMFKSYITLSYFFYSPNLTWFLIACILYTVFPYEIPAHTVTFEELRGIFLLRALFNWTYVFIYFTFWHVTLYWLNWAHRPFVPNRKYSWSKVMHNLFFFTLGVLQWTIWEMIFLYCYATGRMRSATSPLIKMQTSDITNLILWSLAVPIIRDYHFYFAHRFVHVKFIYKYIHALHHRCADIEPFAGLSMHPAEHFYYYSFAPLLLISDRTHPFILFWMGVHVLLSPAASHSGWEDHFQSDLYHYLHHRYYECNYGISGVFFDRIFGTFRDKLIESDDEERVVTQPADAKANLLGGMPENKAFLLLGVFLPSWVLTSAVGNFPTVNSGPFSYLVEALNDRPRLVAMYLSVAPVLACVFLHFFDKLRTMDQRRQSVLRSSRRQSEDQKLIWKVSEKKCDATHDEKSRTMNENEVAQCTYLINLYGNKIKRKESNG